MAVAHLDLDWSAVDSDLLDCIEDNIAVLLAHRGIADLRGPFACEWHFAFHPGAGPMPLTVRTPTADRVAALTGYRLRAATLDPKNAIETWRQLLAAGTPPLLYGDAFAMPWLPYAGNEHMEHGFLVDGISGDGTSVHVVDAYSNLTEWGAAVPTAIEVDTATILAAIDQLAGSNRHRVETLEPGTGVTDFDPASALAENAAVIGTRLRGNGEMVAFAGHYRARRGDLAETRQFVLATWLVARARRLHALWLADLETARPDLLPAGFAAEFATEIAARWGEAQEAAYLMSRRVARGRAAPEAVFDLIAGMLSAAESRAAAQLAEHLAAIRGA
ncbi:MAG: hypothetical protein R3D02_10545 [Hyphomicrobiales bacterium]